MKNGTSQPVKGKLKGQIESVNFEQDVELARQRIERRHLHARQVPSTRLRESAPVVAGADGQAESLSAEHGIRSRRRQSAISSTTEFGIREITSDLNAIGGRAFHINGKNILIRGGGWTPDMMLRENSQRLHDEFRYVRDMGLNTIRLEGKLETQEFFDLADHEGILVMAGWCCCDFWERWPRWKPQDFEIAKQSLRDQIYRLRSHPSIVMWLNGSDNAPPPDVEQMYLDVEKDLLWPNPVVSSATGKKTSVTGDSGVKMSGPTNTSRRAIGTSTRRKASPAASMQSRRLRRRLRLQHRNQHGPGRSADRKHPRHGRQRSHVAHRRRLELPRRRRRIQNHRRLQRRASQSLRQIRQRGRLRHEVANADLRRRARHVRGLQPQQISGHRRHSMDAQQRLALHDLAPLRLLPASRRRIFRRQARHGSPASRLRLRRSFHLGRQQPVRRCKRPEAHHENLQPRHDREILAGEFGRRAGRQHCENLHAARRSRPEPDVFPRLCDSKTPPANSSARISTGSRPNPKPSTGPNPTGG